MEIRDERGWKILETEDDVTPEMEEHIASCVEWFDDDEPMPTEDFLDRFCKTYGGDGRSDGDFDLESYANAAARKIMRIARRLRREARG